MVHRRGGDHILRVNLNQLEFYDRKFLTRGPWGRPLGGERPSAGEHFSCQGRGRCVASRGSRCAGDRLKSRAERGLGDLARSPLGAYFGHPRDTDGGRADVARAGTMPHRHAAGRRTQRCITDNSSEHHDRSTTRSLPRPACPRPPCRRASRAWRRPGRDGAGPGWKDGRSGCTRWSPCG